jgi:23S rRNA pseudouridine2605 synthase
MAVGPAVPEIRLQKVIAMSGLASRRAAERLIESGRVTVNGEVITTLGTKVDPSTDQVRVDGKLARQVEERIYLAMYKPRSVVCTASDPGNRTTASDLLKGIAATRGPRRVFHVGRLDYNSEGLLLFTNDGQLANDLAHPSNQVPRVYQVRVRGNPSGATLQRLRSGIELEDGFARAVELEIIRRNRSSTWVELILAQGRNRLVRRLFAAVGHQVLRLIRVAYGGVEIGEMRPGEVRRLTSQELRLLRSWSRRERT